jgi:spermidine synthase
MGPGVDHVTIAEIERLVPSSGAVLRRLQPSSVMQNPRVSLRTTMVVVLATSKNMFDVITTDLTDPWVKGVASLFTESSSSSRNDACVRRHRHAVRAALPEQS